MHTGFYKIKRKNNSRHICNNEVFGKYLHGHCDEFAETLSERFGYEIHSLWNSDEDSLIHAYCFKFMNDKAYYIDARGITDNWDEFIEEFESECRTCHCEHDVQFTTTEFLDMLSQKDNHWLRNEDFICSLELQDISNTRFFSKRYNIRAENK